MNQLCQRIEEGIQYLPPKDRELCVKFFKVRDFEKLKEIVDSCLFMKRQDDMKEVHKDKWASIDIDKLEDLAFNLTEYVSYLSFPEEEELDNYY